MSDRNDDDVWRSIVENYGERPQVEPALEPDPEPTPAAYVLDEDDPWDEERYVPPPPPPLPHPPPVRLAAWLGIFGSPTLLLIALVLGLGLPSWLGYALVAWFVGGFAYLVVHMQQGPRDPGDDGARI